MINDAANQAQNDAIGFDAVETSTKSNDKVDGDSNPNLIISSGGYDFVTGGGNQDHFR